MGAQYIADKYPEKLRVDFAVNEGAESPMNINGKPCHFISVGEKGPSWLRLKTKGIAGHGSVPYLPNNAVVKMTKVINALTEYQPRVTFTPEVKYLVQEIARLAGYKKTIDESNLDEALWKLGDAALAMYLRAITRMTISPNVIHGGIKTNIVPDSCQAEVDIRVLPGQNKNYVLNELKDILAGADIETIQYSPPTLSPGDTPSYKLIVDTLKETIGDAPVLPSICAGATDSRFLRELGVPSYGIGMMTYQIDNAMKASVHGKNEKLDIKSLQVKSEFLTRLAKKYLGE